MLTLLPASVGLLSSGEQSGKRCCLLSEGAWENQGLGLVKAVGDELVWTYTASHLGHWIAAPLPSTESKRQRRHV